MLLNAFFCFVAGMLVVLLLMPFTYISSSESEKRGLGRCQMGFLTVSVMSVSNEEI